LVFIVPEFIGFACAVDDILWKVKKKIKAVRNELVIISNQTLLQNQVVDYSYGACSQLSHKHR
jgi:hypothetical protein